jgi:hypothetical protein
MTIGHDRRRHDHGPAGGLAAGAADSREVGMFRGISLRLVLRQLVIGSVVAWAVALLITGVWSVFTERSVAGSLPVAAVIVGVLFLVSGGGALSRLGADPDAQSELRLTAGPLPAEQEAERPVGLAPLGLNLLVSPQLIIGGFLLAD